MQYQKLVIKTIKEEIRDFKTIEFEEGLEIKAGQYLTFVHNTLHEEIRRSYSITSAPLLHEPLSIGVKRIDNGVFSRVLTDQAKPGDILYGLPFHVCPTVALYERVYTAENNELTGEWKNLARDRVITC